MKITETERLRVEKVTLEDADFIFELVNSHNWLEFIGDRGVKSRKDAVNYIKSNFLASYDRYGFGLFKISLKESVERIGICGFVKRDYLDHADIGFAMLPRYEGKGYAFEASRAILLYGQSKLKLDPILAITTNENTASRELLHKIGLRQVGTIARAEGKNEFLLFSNKSENTIVDAAVPGT